MESKTDGGPAFPNPGINAGSDHEWMNDMSLRDFFAAKAMQGLATNNYDKWSYLARDAYNIADAMLAARQPDEFPAPASVEGGSDAK